MPTLFGRCAYQQQVVWGSPHACKIRVFLAPEEVLVLHRIQISRECREIRNSWGSVRVYSYIERGIATLRANKVQIFPRSSQCICTVRPEKFSHSIIVKLITKELKTFQDSEVGFCTMKRISRAHKTCKRANNLGFFASILSLIVRY